MRLRRALTSAAATSQSPAASQSRIRPPNATASSSSARIPFDFFSMEGGGFDFFCQDQEAMASAGVLDLNSQVQAAEGFPHMQEYGAYL